VPIYGHLSLPATGDYYSRLLQGGKRGKKRRKGDAVTPFLNLIFRPRGWWKKKRKGKSPSLSLTSALAPTKSREKERGKKGLGGPAFSPPLEKEKKRREGTRPLSTYLSAQTRDRKKRKGK